MNKQPFILILPFVFFIFWGVASAVYANPVCLVGNAAACVGKTQLLKTSANDNAHAGMLGGPPYSAYTNYLCCSESTAGVTVGTSNTGAGILKLFATDNSHVASWSYSDLSIPLYGNKIYISADVGSYTCITTIPNGACSLGTCVAKISVDGTLSNGHIADCLAGNATYSRVCCGYAAAALTVIANPPSVTSDMPTSVQFTVTSGGSPVSGATVTLTGGFTGSCITNAAGQCSITITANIPVTVTASKSPYTDGVTTITINPNPCDTLDCNDNNVCTDDPCNRPTGSCVNPHPANTNPCDDGKQCTSPDFCNGAGSCEAPPNCNTPPNNKCFQLPGACDALNNCGYTPQRDGTACDSGNNCSPGECYKGSCVSGPNVCGGLVPCGRSADDPKTADIDESKPCQVCHLFVLFDRIIDFLLVYILFPLAVLMLVVAGALYVGAVFEVVPGGFQILNQAKGIIFSVVLALIIIFAAYILIGLFLKLIGLADWTTSIYRDWWGQGLFKINCRIR